MEEARPVLVSACLLGRACRYDGRHNADEQLTDELKERGETAVPFCPEEAGGLGTPRPPAWLNASAADVLEGKGKLTTDQGRDVTGEFLAGARAAVSECAAQGIQRAYLKERSPSCGVANTHIDGRLAAGPGVTAASLARAGVEVIGVEGRRLREQASGNSSAGRDTSDD